MFYILSNKLYFFDNKYFCPCNLQLLQINLRANTRNVSFTSVYGDDNLLYQPLADITKCLYLLADAFNSFSKNYLPKFKIFSCLQPFHKRIHKSTQQVTKHVTSGITKISISIQLKFAFPTTKRKFLQK